MHILDAHIRNIIIIMLICAPPQVEGSQPMGEVKPPHVPNQIQSKHLNWNTVLSGPNPGLRVQPRRASGGPRLMPRL